MRFKQRLKQGNCLLLHPNECMLFKNNTGSVSPFGLIHDENRHIIVFLDENLQKYDRISFHPNLKQASLVISFADFCATCRLSECYSFLSLY